MRRLAIAWRHLAGWTYKLVPDTDRRQTNCCIAAERILHEWYPEGAWTRATHADLMIMDGARPWSPIDGIAAAGVGHFAAQPMPGRWHLVQVWADAVKLKQGHTFLYYEPMTPSTDGPYVLEATNAKVEFFRACGLEEKADGREYQLAVLD